jgi:hypothetical protein
MIRTKEAPHRTPQQEVRMVWKKVLAGVALIALTVGVVFGQGNVADKNSFKGVPTGQPQAGVYAADTTARVLRVDTNGALNIVEQYPAQQYQLIAPSILSTQFLHIPGASPSGTAIADSCAPINVQGYSRLALLVYPTSNDSCLAAILALSWRLHASAIADTQSTYLELPWTRFRNTGAGVVSSDSVAWKPDTIGTALPSAARLFRATGGAGISSDDSTAVAGENVLVLNHTSAATSGRFPRGRLIYLTNKDGQPVSGNYISFYWRHLNTVDATSFGFLFPSKEVRIRVRADLVGWR